MKWSKKYLECFERPFDSIPSNLINIVTEKIESKFKNQNPLISIVIITHNESERIFSCIYSLVENYCDENMELIVVDNNSTDNTQNILKTLNINYCIETKQGQGYARQRGLDMSKGKYCLCIDSDTIYPPHYISTHIKYLSKNNIVCTYSLWSFLPDKNHSITSLFLYELLRDSYLLLQNIKRPELVVRGMTLGFKKESTKVIKFRTDLKRGEDGSLALSLKNKGKLKLILSRKARPITCNSTLDNDGSIINSIMKRLIKGTKNFGALFTSKDKYD